MRTGTQIISFMQHAIGATPDSRHDLWATLNEAGVALTQYHDWSWRQEGFYRLQFTAATYYFALPADFDGIRKAVSPYNTPNLFAVVSAEELLRMRSMVAGPGGMYWLAFTTHTNTAGAIVPRGLIHPLPTAAEVPPVDILYRRGWAALAEASPAVAPTIPQAFERALMLLARGMAVEYQTQRPSLELPAAMAELARLKADDISRQMTVGQMTGGAGNVYGTGGLTARGRAELEEGRASHTVW